MSSSELRRRRCSKAIEEVLDFLRKKDTAKDTMKELNVRFCSPGAILESNLHELNKVSLTESEAQLISLIPTLTRHALRSRYGAHPKLDRLSAASEYLKTLYRGVSIEEFYLLCMDASGKLIECRLLQKGSVDQTPFYLGHLLQSVITTRASSIVLGHNHPGGTLRPSQADIKCTLDALRALYPLRISMLDHIIIADDQAVSIRQSGFVDVGLWDQQDPSSALLRNWIDVSM